MYQIDTINVLSKFMPKKLALTATSLFVKKCPYDWKNLKYIGRFKRLSAYSARNFLLGILCQQKDATVKVELFWHSIVAPLMSQSVLFIASRESWHLATRSITAENWICSKSNSTQISSICIFAQVQTQNPNTQTRPNLHGQGLRTICIGGED